MTFIQCLFIRKSIPVDEGNAIETVGRDVAGRLTVLPVIEVGNAIFTSKESKLLILHQEN